MKPPMVNMIPTSTTWPMDIQALVRSIPKSFMWLGV